MSVIMMDQPQKPLDRAVYWIEYVCRYEGALHLRTASRKLNFLQKDHVDVHLIIFLVLLLVLYMLATFISKRFKKTFVSKAKKYN